METPAGRVNGLAAALIALGAAAAFFVLARRAGEAPPLAVWGGAVWVFLLATIVTLPLLAGRRSGAGPAAARTRMSMTLALAVWVCTLPFVFLLVVPMLGLRAAVTTALALLVGIAVVCWTLCTAGGERQA